jgi:hypothetical protein
LEMRKRGVKTREKTKTKIEHKETSALGALLSDV